MLYWKLGPCKFRHKLLLPRSSWADLSFCLVLLLQYFFCVVLWSPLLYFITLFIVESYVYLMRIIPVNHKNHNRNDWKDHSKDGTSLLLFVYSQLSTLSSFSLFINSSLCPLSIFVYSVIIVNIYLLHVYQNCQYLSNLFRIDL